MDKRLRVLKVLNIIVLIISAAVIGVVSVEVIPNKTIFSSFFIKNFQLAVCAMLFVDYLIRFSISRRKVHFFFYNTLLLFVCIPFTAIADYMNIEVSHEMGILLRVMPLVRFAYGVWVLVGYMIRKPIASLFVTYISTLIAFVYFSALLFYSFELGHNPMVTHFSDSLWWAFMDATTVGSNIYAVTGVGKVLSVMLAGLGMMMFPIFTIYITAKFTELGVGKKQ